MKWSGLFYMLLAGCLLWGTSFSSTGCVVGSGSQKTIACEVDTDCASSLPFCVAQKCVQCKSDGNCAEGMACQSGVCQPKPAEEKASEPVVEKEETAPVEPTKEVVADAGEESVLPESAPEEAVAEMTPEEPAVQTLNCYPNHKSVEVHAHPYAATRHGLARIDVDPKQRYIAFVNEDEFHVRILYRSNGLLYRVLRGHTNGVYDVAFSPDGKYVVSASKDTTIKVWEVTTGKLIRTLKGHTSHIYRVNVVKDNIVSAGFYDRTVRIWRLSDGKLLHKLTMPSTARSAELSPDGNTLAIGVDDRKIYIYTFDSKANKWNKKYTLTGHTSAIYETIFRPDGKQLLSVSTDKTLRFWDPVAGKSVASVTLGQYALSAMYSTDGKLLAVGTAYSGVTDGRRVLLYDANTRKLIRRTDSFSTSVRSVALSGDKKYVYGAVEDSTFRYHNVSDGKRARLLLTHVDRRSLAIFSPDGKTLLNTSAASSKVKLLDVANGNVLHEVKGHPHGVRAAAFSEDGQWFATGADDGKLRIFETETAKLVREISAHSMPINTVAFSPNGLTIASGSWDRKVKLWNVSNGAKSAELNHSEIVTGVSFHAGNEYLATSSLAKRIRVFRFFSSTWSPLFTSIPSGANFMTVVKFHPDKKRLFAADYSGRVYQWDFKNANATPTNTRTIHRSTIRDLAFDKSGQYMATASYQRVAKLVRVSDGETLQTFGRNSGFVAGVSLNSDATILATTAWDRSIHLWDIKNKIAPSTKLTHQAAVKAIDAQSNGDLIASGDAGGNITFWNIHTGKEVKSFPKVHDKVLSLRFSHNGKLMASGGEDAKIFIWEVDTGKKLHELIGHSETITAFRFSLDDKTLYSSSWDATIREWDVKTGKELRLFAEHGSDRVLSMDMSPDGKTMISGDYESNILIWDIKDMKVAHKKGEHTGGVTSLAFYTRGDYFFSGSYDTDIRFYTITGGHRISFSDHLKSILSVDTYSDNRFALTASLDGNIRIWDVVNFRVTQLLGGGAGTGHTGAVNQAMWGPRQKTILSASDDMTVRIWKLGQAPLIRSIFDGQYKANATVLRPDGGVAASGGDDSIVREYYVRTGGHKRTYYSIGSAVLSVAYNADGSMIAGGSVKGNLRIWKTSNGAYVKQMNNQAPVNAVIFHPDGKTIFGASDKALTQWNIADGKSVKVWTGHAGAVKSLSMSPDKTMMVSGGQDKKVILWDLKTGKPTQTLSTPNEAISVSFGPANQHIAALSKDEGVHVFGVDGKKIASATLPQKGATTVRFGTTPDVVAVSFDDGTIRFYRISESQWVELVQPIKRPFLSLDLLSEQGIMSATNDNGVLFVWQCATP